MIRRRAARAYRHAGGYLLAVVVKTRAPTTLLTRAPRHRPLSRGDDSGVADAGAASSARSATNATTPIAATEEAAKKTQRDMCPEVGHPTSHFFF